MLREFFSERDTRICSGQISRSGMTAALDLKTRDIEVIYQEMNKKLSTDLENWIKMADPKLPTVLTSHASVEGATFGGERTVSLGKDLILPRSLVADPRIDYSALGHIHKQQDINKGDHPPVVYPGSIERVNFGEAKDEKYFVIADITKGKTKLDWRQLKGIRPFVDRFLKLESNDNITEQVKNILPDSAELKDAIIRVVLDYPRAWDPLIDESAIRELVKESFEFHFVKQPQTEPRIRLPKNTAIGSLSPEELLDQYWQVSQTPEKEIKVLNELARDILHPDQDHE